MGTGIASIHCLSLLGLRFIAVGPVGLPERGRTGNAMHLITLESRDGGIVPARGERKSLNVQEVEGG